MLSTVAMCMCVCTNAVVSSSSDASANFIASQIKVSNLTAFICMFYPEVPPCKNCILNEWKYSMVLKELLQCITAVVIDNNPCNLPFHPRFLTDHCCFVSIFHWKIRWHSKLVERTCDVWCWFSCSILTWLGTFLIYAYDVQNVLRPNLVPYYKCFHGKWATYAESISCSK